nr:hypothetical protein [Micromonospora sp. DSM 115978]
MSAEAEETKAEAAADAAADAAAEAVRASVPASDAARVGRIGRLGVWSASHFRTTVIGWVALV